MASLNRRVALIYMPFADCEMPALGLSLLKSGLSRVSIDSTIFYLNLLLGRMIDYSTYRSVSNGEPAVHDLVGEWIFSESLWGADPERDRHYMDRVMLGEDAAHRKSSVDREFITRVLDARKHVEPFLDLCLKQADWGQYAVVGFSSSFQQQVASLSLAKRMKERMND